MGTPETTKCIDKKPLLSNKRKAQITTTKNPYTTLGYPQTPETVSVWFRAHGICISHWAKAMGLRRDDVTGLIRNRLKGNYGRAHRAAVALGLKPDPNADKGQTA